LSSARRARSVVVALAVALVATPAASEDARPRALERLVRAPALRGARVGVVVERLAGGERLLALAADQPFVPASNQKLLVAAAALARLGPAYRFETPLYVDGEIDAKGVLDGTLWIEGSGDPSLVSETLWRLADEIRLRGVREVRGGIGVDARRFDAARIHPDWEPVSARAYEAPVSAFAANYSSFRIELAAAPAPGSPIVARLAPAVGYLQLRSDATTLLGAGGIGLAIEPLSSGAGELVRVRGALSPASAPRTLWRSVAFPEHYAASLLASQLEAAGVRVHGSVRIGARPETARELLRFEGERLADSVLLQNKWSNNFIAEQLCKALGAEAFGPPGTWEKGTRAIREWLRSVGIDDAALVVADASGLSPRNRVSPAVLTRVVREAAASFAYGPEFIASLPLGGLDGTLEDRMNGATGGVRAKTGHLRHVASLSGVAPGPDGELLAFSVLVNGARGGYEEVDAAVDAFVATLAESDATAARLRAPP
jgi:D-alanyl-D-alanine carboxypeptidase/D-alanyl-D-alanine-endopeptidase (penicillin-binding protein 4)